LALVIQIVLAVVVLLALVATFLSAKNWHWGQVVLALGLFLSATGYAILAADMVRIHRNLRANIANNQERLADLESYNGALQRGTNDGNLMREALPADSPQRELSRDESTGAMPGINELQHRMHLITRLRGRVWRGVQPTGPLGENGQIEVAIPNPKPHGLAKDGIVYAFEAGDPTTANPLEGPQYLGEFRVRSTTADGAALTPTLRLDQRSGERLSRSQGPWNLYETMPVDQHKLFAGLPEENLRQWLPPASIEEYIRDGTPSTEDDDPWHIGWFDAEGKRVGPEGVDPQKHTAQYDRPLRDYALLFSGLARECVERIAEAKALTADNKKLRTALASAQRLGQLRTQEKQVLSKDLTGMLADRDVIQTLLARIQHLLSQATTALDQKLSANSRLASQYAEEQMGLKRQIDQFAPAPSGGPFLQSP
jgi:hypothetical protein